MNFESTVICGRVGTIDIRHSNSNTKVARISVAINRKWKNEHGHTIEKTKWYNCSAFSKTAEIISNYVVKGQEVLIRGEMDFQQHETDSGETKYFSQLIIREIQLGSKPKITHDNSNDQEQISENKQYLEDDLPF